MKKYFFMLGFCGTVVFCAQAFAMGDDYEGPISTPAPWSGKCKYDTKVRDCQFSTTCYNNFTKLVNGKSYCLSNKWDTSKCTAPAACTLDICDKVAVDTSNKC